MQCDDMWHKWLAKTLIFVTLGIGTVWDPCTSQKPLKHCGFRIITKLLGTNHHLALRMRAWPYHKYGESDVEQHTSLSIRHQFIVMFGSSLFWDPGCIWLRRHELAVQREALLSGLICNVDHQHQHHQLNNIHGSLTFIYPGIEIYVISYHRSYIC